MKIVRAGILVAAAAVALAARAQQPSTPGEQAAPPQPAGESSQPSIGDIMGRQQERHIKLWFAGRGGNWPLADYEIDALKGGFDDVDAMLGGSTVRDAVGAPLSALEKAVEGKDRAAFANAFDQLTSGCNSCHHTLGHAFIVIQRPSALPYSDQSFAARRK